MALPLLAAAIPSVVKGITGLFQGRKGRKLAEQNTRATYTRPVEVDQAQSIADQDYYNAAMPGQDLLKNQLESSAAGAATQLQEGASSSGDLLDGINKIEANKGSALSNIQLQAAQYKLGQRDNLLRQLGVSAGYTDQEFDYNQHQPYMDRAALASSMIEGGAQNAFGALGELGQLGVSAAGGLGGKNPAGMKLPMPSFGKFKPSEALTNKIVYNPSLKSVTYGN